MASSNRSEAFGSFPPLFEQGLDGYIPNIQYRTSFPTRSSTATLRWLRPLIKVLRRGRYRSVLFLARGSGVRAVSFFAMGAFLAHAFPLELDPVLVMDDAVEDGIDIGWIANEIVPFLGLRTGWR